MTGTMSRKRILILVAMALLTLMFAACGTGKEEKEKEEIRKVAQKYFDALKIGDQEVVFDCYLPTERQNYDAELGLLGAAGRLFLNIDLGGVLSDINTLFGSERISDQYKYKAADVELDEDGTEAVAYVEVYEGKELYGSVCVNMTKYNGNWYVLRGTIANDDRFLDEAEDNDDSGLQGDGEVTEGVSNDSDRGIMQIGIPILITIISIATAILLIFFLRSRSSKERLSKEIPFAALPGGTMDPGDILCSCGTVNPVGIRTCMGCGKKLKKRR